MPNALFPALADALGGTKTLGWLYSAPALGAFIVMIFSGWTKKIPIMVRLLVSLQLFGAFLLYFSVFFLKAYFFTLSFCVARALAMA